MGHRTATALRGPPTRSDERRAASRSTRCCLPGDRPRPERIGVPPGAMAPVRTLALASSPARRRARPHLCRRSGTAGAASGVGLVHVVVGMVYSLGLILVLVERRQAFHRRRPHRHVVGFGFVATTAVLRDWIARSSSSGTRFGTIATALVHSRRTPLRRRRVGCRGDHDGVGEPGLGFVRPVTLGGLRGLGLACLAVWLDLRRAPPPIAVAGHGAADQHGRRGRIEHSIANLLFVPLGLFVTTPMPAFVAAGRRGAWDSSA